MPADSFGLREQPFGSSVHPGTLIRNRPQQDGLRFLRRMLNDPRGAAWIYGPRSAGKTSLALSFLEETHEQMAVALVDGEGLYASQLLTTILEQFGYVVSLSSTNELLNMLTVFLVQQARSNDAPLLIVDNVHRMYPGALNVLCRLAGIRVRDRFALRLVLLSEGDCKHILNSPSMRDVAARLCGHTELRAFTRKESAMFLFEKLRAAGASQPDDIFPTDVCDALHDAAAGLPGKLDSIAAAVIEQSSALPIRLDRIEHPDLAVRRRDAPRFIITRAGATLLDVELLESRVLVGRSEICDIRLEDQFVSKQHALIVWNSNAVLLVDLNSSNGTYVNSRRIKTRILRNDDVISLGDHRIKMIYPDAGSRTDFEDLDVADTAAMQNIAGALGKRSLRRLPLRVLHAQDTG
jgi:type II secretory pathway predicted ATPase ExeA